MPVTIPQVTLLDIERKDLRQLHFYQSRECAGLEGAETCEDIWYVRLDYVVRNSDNEVYKSESHKVTVWPSLLQLMLPVADEVVIKANQVEGM
jgi:hypothetical protein